MSEKSNLRLIKDDKDFRRDVRIAKEKYRKKRFLTFTFFCGIILFVLSVRIYFDYQDKKSLEQQILTQKNEIEHLGKTNKANEILITRFRNPYFISDLLRKEYSMSYNGEIIFNLPVKESFIENSINSIMQDPENNKIKEQDKNLIIDEKKLEKEFEKRDEERKKREEANAKKEKKLREE